MKENKEKFKQFVIEQLKDYDKWREDGPAIEYTGGVKHGI